MSRRRYSGDAEARATIVRLGRRLREMRERSGLTQSMVALLMGKTGPSGKSHVSQIERGTMPYLLFGSVADYLRAIRRSFADVMDIMDKATAQTAGDKKRLLAVLAGATDDERKRALNYYAGLRTRARKPRDIERATLAAARQAAAVRRDKELKKVVVGVLGELHIGSREPLAINIMAFGRRLFAVLRRTRNSKPAVRDRQLAALDHWAEQHQLPPAPFARVREAILVHFDGLSERGEVG